MSRSKSLGKSIVLILFIIILVLVGIFLFDSFGLISAKRFLAPIHKLLKLEPQTSQSISNQKDFVAPDLYEDRYKSRILALELQKEALNKRESDIVTQEDNNTRIAQELQDKEKALEEKEKTFNNLQKKYDDRSKNIEQIVQNLNAMPPQNAVAILLEMNDQDVIDVLRRADEDAASSGEGSSMGSYWLQLMPAQRAAEISRKMANKPLSLD